MTDDSKHNARIIELESTTAVALSIRLSCYNRNIKKSENTEKGQ